MSETSDEFVKRMAERRRWGWYRLAFAILLVAGWVAWNAYAYGDWTCAFKRCVQIQDVRP